MQNEDEDPELNAMVEANQALVKVYGYKLVLTALQCFVCAECFRRSDESIRSFECAPIW